MASLQLLEFNRTPQTKSYGRFLVKSKIKKSQSTNLSDIISFLK